MKAITEAAKELDNSLIKDFLQWKYNGKPAGNGWNVSVNNAQWGLDYIDRTGTARSSMFANRPNETEYFFTDGTSDGKQLNGKNSYSITFPAGQLPPVKGFLSMTLYNEHHFFYPNDLKRYSLGTKNKGLKKNADGSLTLYAGAKSPGTDLTLLFITKVKKDWKGPVPPDGPELVSFPAPGVCAFPYGHAGCG